MNKYPRINDLKKPAKSTIPAFAWAFLEHGAGRETLLQKNEGAFDQVSLAPNYLIERKPIDMTCRLWDQQYSMPFGVSPVGMGGVVWPQADTHNARAASEAGIAFTLSGVSSCKLEDIAQQSKQAIWFQLYPVQDRQISADLMARARQAGVENLVVTLDVPVAARRETAVKAKLTFSPKITWNYVLQSVLRPKWSLTSLAKGIPTFKNFLPYIPAGSSGDEAVGFVGQQLNHQVNEEELAWIRAQWPGKLLVKGVLNPADAKRAQALGVDGIWVSNHGGRQSDALPPSLDALPAIREAVGEDMVIVVDSGVRSGLDVLRAISKGANMAFLGRPFYYGLAAMGSAGPQHVIEVLQAELHQSMIQLGLNSLDDINAL
jgi:L-lactate dehydrogenase (cytochrome)